MWITWNTDSVLWCRGIHVRVQRVQAQLSTPGVFHDMLCHSIIRHSTVCQSTWDGQNQLHQTKRILDYRTYASSKDNVSVRKMIHATIQLWLPAADAACVLTTERCYRYR